MVKLAECIIWVIDGEYVELKTNFDVSVACLPDHHSLKFITTPLLLYHVCVCVCCQCKHRTDVLKRIITSIFVQSSIFELNISRARDPLSGRVKCVTMCREATRSKRIYKIHFIIVSFDVVNSQQNAIRPPRGVMPLHFSFSHWRRRRIGRCFL